MKTRPNQPRMIGFLLMIILAGVPGALLTGCGRDHAPASQGSLAALYTCGMHPQVVQDRPGNCPICGMKLTPVHKHASGTASTAPRTVKYYQSPTSPVETSPVPRKDSMGLDMVPVYADEPARDGPQVIAVDPVTTQTMGIRTAQVKRGPLRRLIRTVGTIDYNETALTDVTTKYRGWVEKLHADATGQQVHRGEPLFEIYSPELYSAQREYLLALDSSANTPGATPLRESALTKLKFFDISEEQIAELVRTHEPRKSLRVSAPQDGFVVEKAIVQGQLVEAGMKLYRLADLSLVWVQAQIYEQDLAYVRLGQEVTVGLAYLPDREFRGRVTYIYPNVDEKTRTARVRMEFHNPGYFLKPGMFATVEVAAELEPSVVLVPDMAVLRSGQKNTVFVARDGGKFEPRTVVLGLQGERDHYQVISGLSEGERIVTSGQFMLDSESQLREAIEKMKEPGRAPGSGVEPTAAAQSQTVAGAEHRLPPAVKYICPMPEHVSIQYDHPGKCSICGMTLVPVSDAALAKLHPGGNLLYFTCPMPEHSDVRSDKTGKCPKCGMTLIPVMDEPPVAPSAAAASDRPSPGERTVPGKLFTCPMASHADVVADQPGKCPKCEMELVPTSSVAHGKKAEAMWAKQHAGVEATLTPATKN
ncbi:MAG: efflux RND transporter periplasmic adaptor subunit [Verrucomicrobiota bacterium]